MPPAASTSSPGRRRAARAADGSSRPAEGRSPSRSGWEVACSENSNQNDASSGGVMRGWDARTEGGRRSPPRSAPGGLHSDSGSGPLPPSARPTYYKWLRATNAVRRTASRRETTRGRVTPCRCRRNGAGQRCARTGFTGSGEHTALRVARAGTLGLSRLHPEANAARDDCGSEPLAPAGGRESGNAAPARGCPCARLPLRNAAPAQRSPCARHRFAECPKLPPRGALLSGNGSRQQPEAVAYTLREDKVRLVAVVSRV